MDRFRRALGLKNYSHERLDELELHSMEQRKLGDYLCGMDVIIEYLITISFTPESDGNQE